MMGVRLYLIAYDISSPKRWRRVQKIVRRLCRRSQLSVFVCRGTQARLARLETALKREMDLTHDRLMVLDLGPAETAAAKLESINSISDIAELGGIVL
ncbi:MAG: CRISPR-associated endonuclease Cas2 [Hyphomicrobiaceae bacterium]|nr:CRISPR-associated endonuclease Cas2 [Hyphomicrobiaceae bacterium]